VREARAIEDFVLVDGAVVEGAIIVRRSDSIVMEDGSDLPETLLEQAPVIGGAGHGPHGKRIRLRNTQTSSGKRKKG
jgi:hypothetical protein